MEAGFIALTIVMAAIATALGVLLGVNIGKTKPSSSKTYGVVHIDYDEEAGGPWLYLEASAPISEIATQKQVTFDVNVIK